MLVALALTMLLVLEIVRRALEPECPQCSSKEWAAHSTQLHCAHCGWSNTAQPVAAVAAPAVSETAQYDFGLS